MQKITYAVQRGDGDFLTPQLGSISTVPVAARFDTPEEAARHLVRAEEDAAFRRATDRFSLVRIEETSAEMAYEAVPLSGIVDLDGLQFAIVVPLPGEDGFLAPDHDDVLARMIGPTTFLYSSIKDACAALSTSGDIYYGGMYLVGVRSVVPGARYTVTPLR